MILCCVFLSCINEVSQKVRKIGAVHTMYGAACSIGQIDNKMYIYPVHITKTEETHEKNRDEVNWINE